MHFNTFIFRGHCNSTIGAIGNDHREFELAQQIVNRVVRGLEAKGWYVHTNEMYEDNYSKNMTLGNTYGCSGLSIHINSGGGQGCEILKSYNGDKFTREFRILSRLEKLGFKNRGVKSRNYDTDKFEVRTGLDGKPKHKDWYKEIRNARENGNDLGILEIGFIDNKVDMDLLVRNYDEIANIIIEEYVK